MKKLLAVLLVLSMAASAQAVTVRVSFEYLGNGGTNEFAPTNLIAPGFNGGALAVAAGFTSDAANIWNSVDPRGWGGSNNTPWIMKSGMVAPVAQGAANASGGNSLYDSATGIATGIKISGSFSSGCRGDVAQSGASDLVRLTANSMWANGPELTFSGLAASTQYRLWVYGSGSNSRSEWFSDTRFSLDNGTTWSAAVDGHSATVDGRGILLTFTSSATGMFSLLQQGVNFSQDRAGTTNTQPDNHDVFTPGFMLQTVPSAPPVPEPLTMVGAFIGISGLGTYLRKRTRVA